MKTMEELEKEVRRLEIKLEALVDFLQTNRLVPPDGRQPYDEKVNQLLRAAGL